MLLLLLPQVPNSARVQGLGTNRKGTLLLATCHDRVVRMFEVVLPPAGPATAGADGAGDGAQQAQGSGRVTLSEEEVKQRLADADTKVGGCGKGSGWSGWAGPAGLVLGMLVGCGTG